MRSFLTLCIARRRSTKVQLEFAVQRVVRPEYGNVPLDVIRLLVPIRFKLADGSYSETYRAVADTGAHTSLIPRRIWQPLARRIKVANVTLGGINPRPE